MFKKILIGLVVLVLLAAAALAVFIATFNAERYRPLVETKATEAIGFPVKLGGLSLTWKNGLALEVRDVVLQAREGDTGPAPVTVESAFVALDIMPLLQGNLKMGAIVVERPEIRVERAPDGSLRGATELAEAQPASSEGSSASGGTPLALFIQDLKIQEGKFVFHDTYGGRVAHYEIEQIALHLRNVSLLRPFPVQLKAAVFSREQNLTIGGTVHLKLAQGETVLRDFTVDTDLAQLDAEKLAQAFPEVAESGLPELAGKVHVALDDLVLREEGQPAIRANVQLSGGRAALPDVDALENIVLTAVVTDQQLEVKKLQADWGGGKLGGTGQVEWPNAPVISSSFQFSAEGLVLSKIVPPPVSPKDPGMTGTLSAAFKGTLAGPDQTVWMRTLRGDGQVKIAEPVITNLNILNEILSKLSIIPGVSQKIREGLSEEYLKKLESKDTKLEDINQPVRLADGMVFLDSIQIAAETFALSGRAQAALSGPLSGRVFAAIDPEFSAALTRSVRELEYVKDQDGRITIPVAISGTTQKPVILPEVQQIASRLAVSKTQELLTQALGGKKKQTDETTEAAAAGQTASAAPAEPQDPFAALLGQVIQAASQKKSGEPSTAGAQ